MARFRSVIVLYLELLAEGSLDENLIPEIESVFKEVGALAGLDFETIRTGLEPGGHKKKKRVRTAGGRPRRVLKDDALLIADLPDPFDRKDVGAVWKLSRSKSFKRLAKLVEKGLVYPVGSTGSYRVTAKSPVTSPETKKEPSPETKESSPETKKPPSPETKKPQKTAKIGKTTKKEPSPVTSPETKKEPSPETKKPSPETSPETKKPSPETINLAASYPRATGDPATMARADFIPNTGYQAILRSTYFDGQTKKASSRTAPQVPLGLVVGSWRIDDDFKGLHGHEISQLREVLLADLITSELDEFGRVEPAKRADVRRFEDWLEQGREAPPIEVVETNKEKLNHAAWSHDQAVFFST